MNCNHDYELMFIQYEIDRRINHMKCKICGEIIKKDTGADVLPFVPNDDGR